ncbi:MAG: DNA-3-methyladenine glycosylase I [Bacteroidota bacterium]|nr:DNA-3-methyladenine glycosylase I [Bacteroidota bacterium]
MKMVDRDSERCPWCLGFEEYIAYHDTEWGVPVHDDRKQFEFLVLESAQAGLSWATILKRRENYRIAFADFDPTKVAEFGPEKIESLMNNEGIIRNRAKVEAAVNNAKRFLEICEEFGTFSEYIWSFVGDRPMVNHFRSMKEVPASTPVSDALAKDMKKRGFKFLGSTTLYAHMQACGLVNDHLTSCFRHSEV